MRPLARVVAKLPVRFLIGGPPTLAAQFSLNADRCSPYGCDSVSEAASGGTLRCELDDFMIMIIAIGGAFASGRVECIRLRAMARP